VWNNYKIDIELLNFRMWRAGWMATCTPHIDVLAGMGFGRRIPD
jgi:hypothetical protein